jgi:hypothetical protein
LEKRRNRPEEWLRHWKEEKNLWPCQQSNVDSYYTRRHYQNIAQVWKFTGELHKLLEKFWN